MNTTSRFLNIILRIGAKNYYLQATAHHDCLWYPPTWQRVKVPMMNLLSIRNPGMSLSISANNLMTLVIWVLWGSSYDFQQLTVGQYLVPPGCSHLINGQLLVSFFGCSPTNFWVGYDPMLTPHESTPGTWFRGDPAVSNSIEQPSQKVPANWVAECRSAGDCSSMLDCYLSALHIPSVSPVVMLQPLSNHKQPNHQPWRSASRLIYVYYCILLFICVIWFPCCYAILANVSLKPSSHDQIINRKQQLNNKQRVPILRLQQPSWNNKPTINQWPGQQLCQTSTMTIAAFITSATAGPELWPNATAYGHASRATLRILHHICTADLAMALGTVWSRPWPKWSKDWSRDFPMDLQPWFSFNL